MVLLVETIPLADPFLGWRRNGTFFLRSFVQRVLMGVAMELQFQAFVPETPVSRTQQFVIIAFQSTVIIAGYVALSELTGAFPVPFSAFCLIPISIAGRWLPRTCWLRRTPSNTNDEGQRQERYRKLRGLHSLSSFLYQLVALYAVFANIVSHVRTEFQVILIVLLQILRLVVKHTEWTRLHRMVNRTHSHDLAIVTMATNSHLFNALLTATCFQTSKSVVTLVLILLWGVYQDILSFRSIHKQATRVTVMHSDLPESSKTCISSRLGLFQKLVKAWRSQSPSSAVFTDSTHPPFHHSIEQLPPNEDSPQKPITPSTIEWVEGLLQLSHCRELVLMRAYMNLVIPCLYLVIVSAIHTLSNAKHLSYLGHSDVRTLILRLGSQILVRGVVFVWLVHRFPRVDHVTGLHQLEFVLSRQLDCFYGSSVMIALGVFGFSVVHSGNDTTFRFKWLCH